MKCCCFLRGCGLVLYDNSRASEGVLVAGIDFGVSGWALRRPYIPHFRRKIMEISDGNELFASWLLSNQEMCSNDGTNGRDASFVRHKSVKRLLIRRKLSRCPARVLHPLNPKPQILNPRPHTLDPKNDRPKKESDRSP